MPSKTISRELVTEMCNVLVSINTGMGAPTVEQQLETFLYSFKLIEKETLMAVFNIWQPSGELPDEIWAKLDPSMKNAY